MSPASHVNRSSRHWSSVRRAQYSRNDSAAVPHVSMSCADLGDPSAGRRSSGSSRRSVKGSSPSCARYSSSSSAGWPASELGGRGVQAAEVRHHIEVPPTVGGARFLPSGRVGELDHPAQPLTLGVGDPHQLFTAERQRCGLPVGSARIVQSRPCASWLPGQVPRHADCASGRRGDRARMASRTPR